MWGYQPHFCDQFERLLNTVLSELGVTGADGCCLLVGVPIPGSTAAHEFCVEPEDGKWPLDLFRGLRASRDQIAGTHRLNGVFYGDEASNRDLPERIRCDSARQAVQGALSDYDAREEVRSFAGKPTPVGEYHVVPVLQLPNSIFDRHKPLREPLTYGQFTGEPSLIHAAVKQVLIEAHQELLRPDPGRGTSGRSASAPEIVRRAAADFMYAPAIAIGDNRYLGPNLFDRFNLISSLMYEGTEGKGRLLLTRLPSSAIDVALEFAASVPFLEQRWSRKMIQMASADTALLANVECILGLGNLVPGIDPWLKQDVFEVRFHDHYHWSLCCGEVVLLVSKYGVPSLPQEKFPKSSLLDTFARLFPEANKEHIDNFTTLFDFAVSQRHGSMLVVARDAGKEAERLKGQGTKIAPVKLTPELYRVVSRIDGTIIIDPACVCYAVGVILDGPANAGCTPSRGARYNSGIRYVAASREPRMAVVVSDDHTVDVMPILRPRIRRSVLAQHIADLESASGDTYHAAINWLDKHRFYVDGDQCKRVNAALARIEAEPTDVGEIRILWRQFNADDQCTSAYFEDEPT